MIFDHLVLVVNDLAIASRHFTDLGFNVIPGGEHPSWGTHNALIGFEDGSYLELLAPIRSRQAALYRLLDSAGLLWAATAGKPSFHRRFILHLAAGEGFADFALHTEDLGNDLLAARSRGLVLAGPFAGSRRRMDEVEIAWRSAASGSADLPFLIEDLTSRSLRVPSGGDSLHANGVLGVIGLSIACLDLELSSSQYQLLLGFPPEIAQNAIGSPRRACFRLEEMELNLHLADNGVAMRKRAAVPLSISLRSTAPSNDLLLQFSPVKGFTLDPVQHQSN